jgi:hypothetical protein
MKTERKGKGVRSVPKRKGEKNEQDCKFLPYFVILHNTSLLYNLMSFNITKIANENKLLCKPRERIV